VRILRTDRRFPNAECTGTTRPLATADRDRRQADTPQTPDGDERDRDDDPEHTPETPTDEPPPPRVQDPPPEPGRKGPYVVID
jgi:hypothetical protein